MITGSGGGTTTREGREESIDSEKETNCMSSDKTGVHSFISHVDGNGCVVSNPEGVGITEGEGVDIVRGTFVAEKSGRLMGGGTVITAGWGGERARMEEEGGTVITAGEGGRVEIEEEGGTVITLGLVGRLTTGAGVGGGMVMTGDVGGSTETGIGDAVETGGGGIKTASESGFISLSTSLTF